MVSDVVKINIPITIPLLRAALAACYAPCANFVHFLNIAHDVVLSSWPTSATNGFDRTDTNLTAIRLDQMIGLA